MASLSLYLTALLAASTRASPISAANLKARELDVNVDLRDVPSSVKSFFLPGSEANHTANNSRCKVYPGDAAWPSDDAWAQLNTLAGGRLLNAPTPLAAVCYPSQPSYNAAACSKYTVPEWQKSYLHMVDPIEMMSPVAQGMTCSIPNLYDSKGCTRGGYPLYVVNATEPKHVQLAVNFARNSGVRLVVKNTGHDFLGKSGGKDALSIWTHHMKDITYIENYSDSNLNYSGPAFKAGSGVQAFEIYKAAHDKGRVVVGGEGETVGKRHYLLKLY